jgi:hypothetical protein
MGIEAFLLTMYVTSCHALRHLAGGCLDRWTTGISRIRGKLFGKNQHPQQVPRVLVLDLPRLRFRWRLVGLGGRRRKAQRRGAVCDLRWT